MKARIQGNAVAAIGLPTTGVLSDGRSVSNYHLLPDETLTEEGWVEVEDPGPPVHNSVTHQAIAETYVVEGGRVVRPYRVEPRPPHLTASNFEIIADGADFTTVAYIDANLGAPDEATFDVNGATTTVALADGVAEVEVTAAAPGPVVVAVGDLSVTITAEEAPNA